MNNNLRNLNTVSVSSEPNICIIGVKMGKGRRDRKIILRNIIWKYLKFKIKYKLQYAKSSMSPKQKRYQEYCIDVHHNQIG